MSQGSLNVPVTGPVTPTAMAGDINTAADAVISKNSGNSAPANFPTTVGGAATAYQEWADTSPGGGLVDMKEFDGSNWLRKGAHDQTAHVWMPIIGGGSGTVAAGATTDIGSVRQGYMTVTGSVPGTPITSFGSNALLTTGESKFLRFTAAGIITYNASSMILPGAADLSFNVGDSLQALYLGGGNWLCFDFRSNLSAGGRDIGDVFAKWGSGSLPGAVRANGLTIGNGASGGTERANADTLNLFIFLYVRDTSLTVSGGRTAPGNTRATAITDYNLNKTIVVPDLSLSLMTMTTTALLSGSANYTQPSNCHLIKIRQKGPGGGGGAATANNGAAGTDSSFNGIVSKSGGGGSAASAGYSAGGTGGTGGAGAADLTVAGQAGINGTWADGFQACQGGTGGGTGGARNAGGAAGAGANAAANTGGGGGGGQGAAPSQVGGGGGEGEYREFRIANPAGPYAYVVGTGGTGGAAGTQKGGDGGSGWIMVDEFCGPTQYMAL